ncbi:minor capsid protein [Lacticaseibacillus absianus]|uniref:minor capsid protein n=1 Tax=Lacticaseibacillus absianus TaxID=2729623 RepID=UPI0015CA7E8D|nr:minor capsid protein [Lacticaseibacillus absianus]
MTGIKVTTNVARLRKKVSPASFRAGQRALASQVGMDSNRFVPKGPPQAGHLRSSQVIAADASFVSWMAPYAARQFDAPAGWRYTTPGTGPKWTEVAKAKYTDSWIKALMKGAGL